MITCDQYVYAIRVGAAVKIGCSGSPRDRMAAMSTKHGRSAASRPEWVDVTDVEPLFAVPGNKDTERLFHLAFAELLVAGTREWFHYADRLKDVADVLKCTRRDTQWPFKPPPEPTKPVEPAALPDSVDFDWPGRMEWVAARARGRREKAGKP